jgi:hypothetical protein
MGTGDDENADLRKRVAELEAKLAPPQSAAEREREDREYMSKVHADRERRMNLACNFFTREDYRAFEAATPTAAIREDVAKGGVRAPAGQVPISDVSQVGPVHTSPGIGVSRQIPLGPQPGIDLVDRQLDAQDRRDKAERMRRG